MKRYLTVIWLALGLIGCGAPSPTPLSATPTPPVVTATASPAASTGPGVEGSALLLTYRHIGPEVWRDEGLLQRIDLTTGQPLSGVPTVDAGMFALYAASQDGRWLALAVYPDNNQPASGALHLVDTQTLHDIFVLDLPFPGWIGHMAFSPDGRRLALTGAGPAGGPNGMPAGYHLALVDVSARTISAQTTLNLNPRLVRFLPDSATVAVYGTAFAPNNILTAGPAQVALLDARDAHSLWSAALDGVLDGQYGPEQPVPGDPNAFMIWQAAAALSADGMLYIVHADADRLTRVDFTRRQIASAPIARARSILDDLFGVGAAQAKGGPGVMKNAVLSADGSELFVVGVRMEVTTDASGTMDIKRTPLGLSVVDTASGALLHHIDLGATDIAMASGGRQLFLYDYDGPDSPNVSVMDAAALDNPAPLNADRVVALRLASGRSLYLVNVYTKDGTTLRVLDASTLGTLAEWSVPDSAQWIEPQP